MNQQVLIKMFKKMMEIKLMTSRVGKSKNLNANVIKIKRISHYSAFHEKIFSGSSSPAFRIIKF